jgi:NAD(P)-dependent dehydrogenase (short-subunit alcohol dehydrogenase family)
MMSANLETVHRSMRALLPSMVSRGDGSIVVIGSRNVERPWTGASAAAYTASKAAVVAFAQAVAAEVLTSGVRVNAVLPSTLDTEANRRAMPDADPKAWVSLPSAAKVIAFLLSEDARDISGAAIPLYGRA